MFLIALEKLLAQIYDYIKDRLSSEPVPSPADLYLGEAEKLYHRDKQEKLFLSPEIRRKHLYLIGGTGMGKTTLIEHFIREDILHNQGFCLLEPHADLSENIIRFIADLWAKQDRRGKAEIAKRTILVEPFSPSIVTFNPLEVAENSPVYPCILELMQVFKQKWSDMWGPRMAELLRATMVVLAENQLTLVEAPMLLTNTRFRNSLIANLENEEVKDYFIQRYNKLREWDKVKYREPALNKICEFLTDKSVRHTIGQTKSSLDFREVMDGQQWIILNLAKGLLKTNALLLGGLFLAKLQMASLSRVDIPFAQRKLFYIYLDEFQNFINQEEGGDIETMLSESRKYGLSLIMAHQNLSQLDIKLLGSILGNVNTLISFRLSRKDSVTIAPEIDPGDKDKLIKDLINLKVGQAYVKVKGEPARLVQLPYPQSSQVSDETIQAFKQECAFYHALSSQGIEKQIQERHQRLGLKTLSRDNNQLSDRDRRNRERNILEKNDTEGQNEW